MSVCPQEKRIYVKSDLTSFTKINSQWIIEPNAKLKTIKPLQDNIGDKYVSKFDKFLDIIP
jgi:hypothetical protein